MLTVTLSFLCVAFAAAQQLVSRDTGFKGIVGISKDGDTLIYNGLIVKHWQKTQTDEIKIKKADVNPVDNMIYAVELSSAIVYRKPSFTAPFEYVDCCATAFTFVDSQIEGLPNSIKLLVVDGKTLFAKRHFNDHLIGFDIDIDVQDISSVNGAVLILSKDQRLYSARFLGEILLQDITSSFSRKFKRMTSLNAWRSAGKFLATSEKHEVWMSTPNAEDWGSFGNGRSCCVRGAFEIPNIESFAEQSYPFCTQNNLQHVPLSTNGNCGRTEDHPFGYKKYKGQTNVDLPCLSYLSSTTISPTAQDLLSDYKIAVKGVYQSSTSRIGIAFNLRDEQNFDYVYIDPENRKDCWGMGHMTPTGPVDRADLNTGCPGGTPPYGTPFILEVQTFERQVIVKLDGYTIFSRYPMLDNMAAGGLLLWANSNDHNDAAPVLTYGLGVCYVPNEKAYDMENVYDTSDFVTEEKPHVDEKDVKTGDFDPAIFAEYSSVQVDVTTATTPTSSSFTTTDNNNGFSNEIVDPEDTAAAGIELLSGGIRYQYYVYKEPLGFTSANKACERMGMSLLLIEDEVQNSRIAILLRQEEVEQVWLGKFWIGKWEISLYDGSHLDWKNFAERPQPSNSPIFAAIRMDGFWNSVDGRTKYSYVCQSAVQVDFSDNNSNEGHRLNENGEELGGEIASSFEASIEHPPVIIYGPVNVTAEVGDTVQFRCTASSKPPSTVILVKIDDESLELPSKGDPLDLNDESQRVTIIVELEAVTMDDAGKYVCIAQNELGEASSPAWLHIEEESRLLSPPPSCMLWGDPHIMTYDRKHYNFPGKCSYVLSTDCSSSSFWIYGLFKECGGNDVTGPSLTALDSVTIYVRVADGNHTGVELQRGWVVNIGGSKLRISEGMSARHGNLIIRRTAEHVFVTLPNKILVQWDGLQMVNIQLPPNFPHDKTCGLCGKYNLNPDDDFYIRNGPTDVTENAIEFANTWALSTWYIQCPVVPLTPTNPCDAFPERARLAEFLCSSHLFKLPFSSCHDTVDATVYYDNCKQDFCGSEWRRKQDLPLCNSLSAYALACELAGRPISSWRSGELCPITEIKEITKEEGCPWDELNFDFDAGADRERDSLDGP